ncbi:helix-turn-helix domain-containing protein [Zunongwangia sp. HRR-M8]|uniref:helix-turn-helix domain-containing protein n=1 Tax=Zunongwangia sp. HRR-M8 TaxID=3015170 RepID=UPI0022DD952A|nr:helix-turn-helix domain-containing protein [Zunongwangia sp. HRR-M8]WBL20938.1 helix-turn-helix domain-containing protein [Zunongwangia sp. HRR-M8]
MENQNLSSRIKNFRIQKGFSQEALAEHSGLSVRTIQRMENNDSMPNADSLKKVAEALKIPIEKLSKNTKSLSDLQYLKALNLSALSSLIFVFWFGTTFPVFLILSCFIPAIMWVWKKDQIEGIDALSKKIINIQLTWTIFAFLANFFINDILFKFLLPPLMQFLKFDSYDSSLDINNNYIWGGIILLNVFLILINTFKVHSKEKLRSFLKINFIK